MSSAAIEQLTIPAVEPMQQFVFYAIDYATFQAICDAVPERSLRLAYDGSNLEIMSKTSLHGRLNRFLCQLVYELCEALNVEKIAAGDFTLRRDDVERGIEPDECFYIKNAKKVRSKKRIDILVDPPPDLAIEVDVSRSSVARLPIYAKLKVDEIWRLTESRLECLVLQGGKYVTAPTSIAFPGLDPAELFPFVARMFDTDESILFEEFRTWVRERFAAN